MGSRLILITVALGIAPTVTPETRACDELGLTPTQAIPFDTGSGATGHLYEVVIAPSGITWDDAQADALARGGYLATILSADENDFVFALIDSALYWVSESPGSAANLGPWIGGRQAAGSLEPGDGWAWVNNDGPFVFTAWHGGEPSNGAGSPHGLPESRLHYFEYSGRSKTWNDLPQTVGVSLPIAYVVEYSEQPPAYSATVQPPINSNGSSVFNAKRGVVPVKFMLAVNGAPTCELVPATISLTRVAGGTVGSVNESLFNQPSDDGTAFRIDSTECQYIYNLGVGSIGVGTYVVHISINGMAAGTAQFSLQ